VSYFRDGDVLHVTDSHGRSLYQVYQPSWWRLDRHLVVLLRRMCGRPLVTMTTVGSSAVCQRIGPAPV
jgi:hypothetical protein